ncbi:MAG: M15 family metallopeptidase [Rikenellaceae bacterium]
MLFLKSLVVSVILCTAIINSCNAQSLQARGAGEIITKDIVDSLTVDKCFVVSEIDQDTFQRIYGKSYGEECNVMVSELRYLKLLHYNINEQICIGEMVCNVYIANDLIEIFRQLYDAHYPIERMVLIDDYNADDNLSMVANNSSCFNFRHIAGKNSLSSHSLGLAVDINPLYNPHVKYVNGKRVVTPSQASEYADRDKDFAYKIDRSDLLYKLMIKYGFEWGGAWKSSKDYQHFEKKKP